MVELFQELTFHMIRMLELEPKLEDDMSMMAFASYFDLTESKSEFAERCLFTLHKYVCNGIVLAADGEMVMLLGNKSLRGKKQLNLTTPLFHSNPPEGMETYDRIGDLMDIIYAIQQEFSEYILYNKHGGAYYEQKTIFDEMDEKEHGFDTIEINAGGKSVTMTAQQFDKAVDKLTKN